METRDALLFNISVAAARIKNNSEEYMRATGSIKKKVSKYMLNLGGGPLNVGSKASNKILTSVLAGLFY